MAAMYDKIGDYEINISSSRDKTLNDFEIIISHPSIKTINYFFIGTLEEAYTNACGFIHGFSYKFLVRIGE